MERRNSSNFLDHTSGLSLDGNASGDLMTTPVAPRRHGSRVKRKLVSELEKLQRSTIFKKYLPTKTRTRSGAVRLPKKDDQLNWDDYDSKFREMQIN